MVSYIGWLQARKKMDDVLFSWDFLGGSKWKLVDYIGFFLKDSPGISKRFPNSWMISRLVGGMLRFQVSTMS